MSANPRPERREPQAAVPQEINKHRQDSVQATYKPEGSFPVSGFHTPVGTTTTLRDAERKQTRSFRDWCAWVQEKTDSRQVWNGRYRDTWNHYLETFGLDVMIGLLMERDFELVEYAIKALQAVERHPKSAYIQTVCRERYLAAQKAEDTAAMTEVIDGAVDFNGLAAQLAGEWRI